MVIELIDVHGVVVMTSGFIDDQGHSVVRHMEDVDIDGKTSLEIRHLV